MNSDNGRTNRAVRRGSVERASRARVLEAAGVRFKKHGYERTRVAEIARDVGFSKAYIYKLFGTKQDLGDAVCKFLLADILDHIDKVMAESATASEKLRILYSTLVADSVKNFFNDQTLYEICAISAKERWPSTAEFIDELSTRMTAVLQMGRETGEFERKTPLADVRSAIFRATMSLANPMMLQYQLEDAELAIDEVTTLILRSLAP